MTVQQMRIMACCSDERDGRDAVTFFFRDEARWRALSSFPGEGEMARFHLCLDGKVAL